MIINDIEYKIFPEISFDYKEIISDNQAHILTDKGIILIDTSLIIDGVQYKTIQEIINYLNSK